MNKRIFITGGHFAPAKAVIPHLQDWDIYYLGRKYAMEDDLATALEYTEISRLPGVVFLAITAGRLQRRFFVNPWQSVRALMKIPIGFFQALYWTAKFRPAVVLSFGGYVAVPVVLAARFFGIPTATHEQTRSLGLANKIIRLLGAHLLETGNPLRAEILAAKPKTGTNILYITGGNQGSHALNVAVAQALGDLTARFEVIHQMGDSGFRDFEAAAKLARYHPHKFLSGQDSADVLSRARIVVSRAGANTVQELAYFGIPAVLVPIPWSSGNEQEDNARTLEKIGLAEILHQADLSGKTLSAAVRKIDTNYAAYKRNAAAARKLVNPGAAEAIAAGVTRLTKFSR